MSIASKTELQPVAVEAAPTAAVPTPQARSRSIKPLLGLVPFVMRYRARVVAALIALVVAAVATLAVSIALRTLVLFFGSAAMMVVTSARLSAFVLGAIPVIVLPLVAFGRMVRKRSRTAQDTLADASAYASELIGAVRTLQAFTNEKL